MKKHYSISIPKPCHENWDKMLQEEKGKFCQSCSKSVIDFTQMPQQNIQDYLAANRDKNVCGRFKVSQLAEIRIEIPQHVIQQHLSFQKLFLLALLITMGTSLLNCSDQNGNTNRIDAVEVISTLEAKSIQIPEIEASKIEIDTTKTITILTPPMPIKIIDIPIPTLKGDVVEIMGMPEPPDSIINDEDLVFGYMSVVHVPEFSDTPKELNTTEKKDYMTKRINEIITKNFNSKIGNNLNLKGKQRIHTKFTINKTGHVTDIKIRAPHPLLKAEALRIIKLLPQFTPGQQRGRNVSVTYTLPIIFIVKD